MWKYRWKKENWTKIKETDRNRKTSQENQMCQMIKVKNRSVCVADNNEKNDSDKVKNHSYLRIDKSIQ